MKRIEKQPTCVERYGYTKGELMAESFLVIWRDEEAPSTTILTAEEIERLLHDVAELKIKWIYNLDDLDSSWFYDRMEDWPARTGVIIRIQVMRPRPIKVVTKYLLE